MWATPDEQTILQRIRVNSAELLPVVIDGNSQADTSETDLLLHPVLINVNCMLTNPKRIFFFTPC
jgi:hypothetical protein